MKKIYCVILIICFLFTPFFVFKKNVSYCNQNIDEINYKIYENDTFLFERPSVHTGDIIITKDFSQYEIYLVDETTFIAKARRLENLDKPKITKKGFGNITASDKKISLYMTHNDESYLDGDGTDSVYGAGGIHDVTQRLAYYFKQKGVNITVDETLHIPHNSSAYSRSKTTALKLLKDNPSALFDIHRDGVSRSAYITKVDGKEKCQVRIVVGQANPNKEQNLKFAKYLMSVAETICPWLFCDIYYAKGNYNQNLYEKALLFEMGTYTMEKELVMETVPELVNVICTTLFNTTVDQQENLVIGNSQPDNPTVDEFLQPENKQNQNNFFVVLIILIVIASISLLVFYIVKNKRKI